MSSCNQRYRRNRERKEYRGVSDSFKQGLRLCISRFFTKRAWETFDALESVRSNFLRIVTSRSCLGMSDSIQHPARCPATIQPRRAGDICASRTHRNLNHLTGDRRSAGSTSFQRHLSGMAEDTRAVADGPTAAGEAGSLGPVLDSRERPTINLPANSR